MKNLHFKLLSLFALLLLVSSCEGESNDENPSTYLPAKIVRTATDTYGVSQSTTHYTYNQSKQLVLSVESSLLNNEMSAVDSTLITYGSDKKIDLIIKRLRTFSGQEEKLNERDTLVCAYASGKVFLTNTRESGTRFAFLLDSEEKLMERIDYYNGRSYMVEKYTHDSKGNVIEAKVRARWGNILFEQVRAYDDKKGYASSINMPAWFFDHIGMSVNFKNNMIDQTTIHYDEPTPYIYKASWTYNDAGYPVSGNFSFNDFVNRTATTTIDYIQVR
ncbi:MAG: hypothetical protein RL662_433 [Bacteroidota bacterium]|jgi:hypothetical protein